MHGRSCEPVVVSGVQGDVIHVVPRPRVREVLAGRGLDVSFQEVPADWGGNSREQAVKLSKAMKCAIGTATVLEDQISNDGLRLIHKRFMTEDQAALRKTLTKDFLVAWRCGQETQFRFATCLFTEGW